MSVIKANGELIKSIRLFLGLEQKDWANMLKISQSYLSKIENGKVKTYCDSVERLARGFYSDFKQTI